MIDSPAISCVLPVYNGENYLDESIQSIIDQTFTDWELIIVDDASTDTTPEIIRSFHDPRVRCITNTFNRKLPASLNGGFAAATGKFWTWTSHDNAYLPTAFETLIQPLLEGAHVTWSPFYIIDAAGEFTGEYQNYDISNLRYENVIGASFMFAPEVFHALHGYDESLFRAEDWDFWIRACRRGFKFRHIQRHLYTYRRHPGMLGKQWLRCELASARVAQRHYGIERAARQFALAVYQHIRDVHT